MEALGKPDDQINNDFEFWNTNPASQLKDPFLKYCKVYQNRVQMALRVLADDEETSTLTKVKGMITEWKNRTPLSKQKQSDFSLELQFLEVHRRQYLELSSDFAKISYMPKTKSALANMKELILLDLKILLGADITWQPPSKQMESLLPAAALPEAAAGDDNSVSGADDKSASGAEDEASGGAAAGASRSQQEPAAEALDVAAPDPTNFLTWRHDNWDAVAFDQIRFPADKTPLKNKAYYAVAIIFLNTPTLRAKHKTVWTELTTAWADTFGVSLTDATLGMPPIAGPNAFSNEEQEWCTQTLRFFGAGAGAREADRRTSSYKRQTGPDGAAKGGSSAKPAATRQTAPSTPSAAPQAAPSTPSAARQTAPSTPSARCLLTPASVFGLICHIDWNYL